MPHTDLLANLLAFLYKHPASRYWLAYSGGIDSHALLHACASLRRTYPQLAFHAIHLDHGLQPDSAQWAQHCQQVCQALGMPCTVERLHLQIPAGESVEAYARRARYTAFARHVQAGEMVLTAHHQDDQAETLLLNLLRGAGAAGLAAMPAVRPLGAGQLGRPWLCQPHQHVLAYATQQGLAYLTDPSNHDTRFDRNFLRQQVMPLLKQRWTGATQTLARAAQWQGENQQILAACMQQALPQVQCSRFGTLSVQRLLAHDAALQKALLRAWLAGRGLPLPDSRRLQQIVQEVLPAKADAQPCVQWEGCTVRRYRDDLYAIPSQPSHDPRMVLVWDVTQPLAIPSTGQVLQPEQLGEWHERALAQGLPVQVRFRQGGEKVWLPQRGGHHDLKKLLQEAGIPPWLRHRIPLVYVGGELVWVALPADA